MYHVGTKFYKFSDEENYEVIRLLRIKNINAYVFLNDKGERIKLTKEEASSYTKLNSDANVSFAIVLNQDKLRDIIVSIYRAKDLSDGINLPYAICRQNVFDIFSNAFAKQDELNYVGCSVSVDTCPSNIDYKMFLSCNEIIENTIVDMYMDDNLEDILQFVNTANYNSALYDLYRNMSIAAATAGARTKYEGYCANLRSLLESNNFRHDMLKAFDIEPIPWIIKDIPAENNFEELEKILKFQIINPVISKFSKEIDMTKIQRDHQLLKDNANDLYVMVYTKGESMYSDNLRENLDMIEGNK